MVNQCFVTIYRKQHVTFSIRLTFCGIEVSPHTLRPQQTQRYMSHPMTKPMKWSLHPTKTQISLVWLVFAVHSMGRWGPSVSSCGQWRLWSDWANAQADLSLRLAHKSFRWFCVTLVQSVSYDRHKTVPNWSLKAGHFAKVSAHSKVLCRNSYIVEINWPFKSCQNLESFASISEDMFESSCTHEPSFSLHVTLMILKWCMLQILFMWQSMIWSNIWFEFCFMTLQHI